MSRDAVLQMLTICPEGSRLCVTCMTSCAHCTAAGLAGTCPCCLAVGLPVGPALLAVPVIAWGLHQANAPQAMHASMPHKMSTVAFAPGGAADMASGGPAAELGRLADVFACSVSWQQQICCRPVRHRHPRVQQYSRLLLQGCNADPRLPAAASASARVVLLPDALPACCRQAAILQVAAARLQCRPSPAGRGPCLCAHGPVASCPARLLLACCRVAQPQSLSASAAGLMTLPSEWGLHTLAAQSGRCWSSLSRCLHHRWAQARSLFERDCSVSACCWHRLSRCLLLAGLLLKLGLRKLAS